MDVAAIRHRPIELIAWNRPALRLTRGLQFVLTIGMCGRYVRRGSAERVRQNFRIDLEDLPCFVPSYNVAPQSTQPVVVLDRETGKRQVHLMRWGLIPFWATDAKIGLRTINARAEDIASKPAFREALKRRRCLVPADSFYEWKRITEKQKQPYAIGLADGEMYAFAGLWERWKAPDGKPLETFTIVTTDPNELMEPLHDRMPVIVDPKDYDRWLEPGDPAQPPLDLLRPYPAERMTAWRVAKDVGNVQNNHPELMDPCPADTLWE